MGLLDHRQLMIVKGIGETPGDTLTAEQQLISIDLLDNGTGVSVALNEGWIPNISSLKSGGVWADSPISNGRKLIAGANTNVTETLRLIVSSLSVTAYAAKFASLQRMIQDARLFGNVGYQIEPIYLAWWAAGSPGFQYARIFNIDMDVQIEDSEDAQATLTLTIEREEGWLGVRPGMSPKEWTYYIRRQPFNANNAYVNKGSINDHFASGTLKNCTERDTLFTTITGKNYIDIPASNIPGDLPALATIWVTGDAGSSHDSVIISRWTRRNSINISGADQFSSFTLAAGDAQMDTDTTSGADTGGLNGKRTTTAFVTTSLVNRVNFTNGTQLTRAALYSGRFILFLRARLSAAGTVGLQARIGINTANLVSGEIKNLTDQGVGGTGNTSQWGLVYLGQFSIPNYDASLPVGATGKGIDQTESFTLSIAASRLSGTPSLYISDVIFIPIDECASLISTPLFGINNTNNIILDNTGYLSHGQPGDYGFLTFTTSSAKLDTPTLSGQGVTLLPGVNNRLYFLQYNAANLRSVVNMNFDIGINIVPRWSAMRDDRRS